MSAHTLGTWYTKREGRSTVYVEARIGGGLIQEVAACGPTANGSDEQESNARLIDAAPELLDALLAVRKDAPLLNGCLGAQVDAAIAKATGGAA